MTDLDVFLPSIMPYAPGCPEPTARAAIITAARMFCERTRLWRDNDQFTVTPTSCNVVCAPVGGELFEIEHASLDGRPLEPISIGDLDRNMPDWRTRTEAEGARWITQVEMGSVLVVPRTTGTLSLSVFLKPAEDADQLPDFLAQHYRRIIADGALAEILMTPGQPFTAPDRAQFYSMRFESRLGGLVAQSITGQQRAKLRTRPQYF
jgi:hypothetical protein